VYITVIYKNRKSRQSNRFPNAQLDAQTSADKQAEFDNLAVRQRWTPERSDGDAHKVGSWFELAIPVLGNISPRNVIRVGLFKRLLSFVLDSREAETAVPKRAPEVGNTRKKLLSQ
jgi:hypothetical protein